VVKALRTRAAPWFVVGIVLFVVAAVGVSGTARDVAEIAAIFVLIGACIRAVALSVRDDDVSSGVIRSPAGRTLAFMGADSRRAARRRRREHEAAVDAEPAPSDRDP
jgi:hypothetical protein